MFKIYILIGIITFLGLLVFLSFLGPEKSNKPFWRVIQSMRAVLDKISYLIICAIGIGGIALTVVYLVKNILVK